MLGSDSSGSDQSYVHLQPIEEDPVVDIDYPDTWTGPAEILGEWENRYDTSQTVAFRKNGVYFLNGVEFGTYEVHIGYVLLTDNYHHATYLRMVADENGEFAWLQEDNESIPTVYRRAEGKDADPLLDPNGDPIDGGILRMYADTVLQILRKSSWSPLMDTVRSVKVSEDSFSVTSNSGAVSVWPYQVTSAVGKDGGYLVDLLVNSVPYKMTILSRGEYGAEGYRVIIQDGDSVLLEMQSYQQVGLEQPD